MSVPRVTDPQTETALTALVARRDRIVVSTLRCGRSNPGSNPGHGIETQCHGIRVCFYQVYGEGWWAGSGRSERIVVEGSRFSGRKKEALFAWETVRHLHYHSGWATKRSK